MVASQSTVKAIADLIEAHADDPMEMAEDLAKIDGNQSFKDTTKALLDEMESRGYGRHDR